MQNHFKKLLAILIISPILFLLYIYIYQRFQSPESRFTSFISTEVPNSITSIECLEDWSSIDPKYLFIITHNGDGYDELLRLYSFKESKIVPKIVQERGVVSGKSFYNKEKKHWHFIAVSGNSILYLITTT